MGARRRRAGEPVNERLSRRVGFLVGSQYGNGSELILRGVRRPGAMRQNSLAIHLIVHDLLAEVLLTAGRCC
jgi:hypothetical protein